MKKFFLISILGIILIGGWLIYEYLPRNCGSIFYIRPMSGRAREKCTCPEGYEKFQGLMGAYCATDSQMPCSSHIDCPANERCISEDGESWFCSGRKTGCYFWDPENPEIGPLCVD